MWDTSATDCSATAISVHGNIVAEEHFDGPITIEVPVIDKNFNYWFAGIGVSYNLSALYKGNKKIRQSKATLNQSKEQLAEATEHTTDAILSTFTDYEKALSELATQKKIATTANNITIDEAAMEEAKAQYDNALREEQRHARLLKDRKGQEDE